MAPSELENASARTEPASSNPESARSVRKPASSKRKAGSSSRSTAPSSQEVEPSSREAVPVVQLHGRMADRTGWFADRCSIGRALDVVGTRSAMLLMREAYYGTTRFDDFAQRVGITEAVAATRLKELVAAGLLVREPYRDPGQRTRYEYRLTGMGRDLAPATFALMQWGDRYLSAPLGPPVDVRHTGCDAHVRVELRCADGHDVPLGEISARFAPQQALGPVEPG